MELLRHQNVNPNFWLSLEYIQKAGLVWFEQHLEMDRLMGLKSSLSDLWWFFPPIDQHGRILSEEEVPVYASWASFHTRKSKLLDYQFIYNPVNFQDLSGNHWAVFRKNVRKYPKRHPGTKLTYGKLEACHFHQQIAVLLVKWAEGKNIQDNETCINYCFYGGNRWALFADKELIGLNVYDENWNYINYRYCIDNKEPFLNEYLRYCFYTCPEILDRKKLVNDGGCLDSQTLFQFKQKLNPYEVEYVVTTIPEERAEDGQTPS